MAKKPVSPLFPRSHNITTIGQYIDEMNRLRAAQGLPPRAGIRTRLVRETPIIVESVRSDVRNEDLGELFDRAELPGGPYILGEA